MTASRYAYSFDPKKAIDKNVPLGQPQTPMAELLAQRLKKWRGALRQKEAAAKLDIPLPTYRKYENGHRSPNKLAAAELERRLNAKSL